MLTIIFNTKMKGNTLAIITIMELQLWNYNK